MEQAINLIDILAWPLVTLWVIWIIRKPLSLLVEQVGKIKYKGVEIEFTKQLEEISNQSERRRVPPGQGSIADEPQLSAIIEASPAAGVREAWRTLHVSARKKVEQLLPVNETFQNPLDRPLEYLEDKGALIPSTVSTIYDLRSLRNQVVHIKDAAISREDAIRYTELTISIRRQIDAITDLPKVELNALTLLILRLNRLIDSKKYDEITVDEVYHWVEEENIFESLAEKTKGEFSFGDYDENGPYANFSSFYYDQMKSLANVTDSSTFGVENLGLCLLIAWANELVQQGAGWHPAE